MRLIAAALVGKKSPMVIWRSLSSTPSLERPSAQTSGPGRYSILKSKSWRRIRQRVSCGIALRWIHARLR
jgi:hypothetical protein